MELLSPPFLSGAFAKVSRLRDVALDRGVAYIIDVDGNSTEASARRVDCVRTMVASNIVRTREKLVNITSSGSSVQRRLPFRELTMENVRALGLGLLDRTEAVLDLLLPPAGRDDAAQDGDADNESGHTPSFSSTWQSLPDRVPRSLPIQVLQTFAVRLSEHATLRVTILGMQDACASLVQRLHLNPWQALKRLRYSEDNQLAAPDQPFRNQHSNVKLGNLANPPAVALRAARMARQGCERLLGKRVLQLLDSSFALWLLGGFNWGGSDEELDGSNATGLDASMQAEVLSEKSRHYVTSDEPFHEVAEALSSPRCESIGSSDSDEPFFRLVVKNSFFEYVKEPNQQRLRRARSCEASFSSDFTHNVGNAAASSSNLGNGDMEEAETAEPVSVWVSLHNTLVPFSAEDSAPKARPGDSGFPDSETSGHLVPRFPLNATDINQPCIIENDGPRTTVMLRNIPPDFTRTKLIKLLNDYGFQQMYRFVYLPFDFTHGLVLGYALVGFDNAEDVERLRMSLEGVRYVGAAPEAPRCEISWSEPHRDIDQLIERYKSSPVMHANMPDEFKPALFVNGERVPFPLPTKSIRAPRVRNPKK